MNTVEKEFKCIETEAGLHWSFFTGTKQRLLQLLLEASKGEIARTIAVCNAHMFVLADKDKELRYAIENFSFAICDGQPLAWMMSILLGRKVERITGPDLFEEILLNRISTVRVALVGGRDVVLDRIIGRCNPEHVANLLAIDPGFVSDGGDPDPQDVERLVAYRPDITFVGLGCPKQEKWIHNARVAGVNGTIIGVGAAFDYFAGSIRRAPTLMRSLGLEWFCRMLQQPRLFSRYISTNFLFIEKAIKVILLNRLR